MLNIKKTLAKLLNYKRPRGTTVSGNYTATVTFRRTDNIVTAYSAGPTAIPLSKYLPYVNIPSGYRPIASIRQTSVEPAGSSGTIQGVFRFTAYENGSTAKDANNNPLANKISVYHYNGSATGQHNVGMQMTWITNDPLP
ncbi:MAG: hypothetical protein IJ860_09250 [Eubacterium sp.]|nr:hypothetical protein [Eubacterium sp.]